MVDGRGSVDGDAVRRGSSGACGFGVVEGRLLQMCGIVEIGSRCVVFIEECLVLI